MSGGPTAGRLPGHVVEDGDAPEAAGLHGHVPDRSSAQAGGAEEAATGGTGARERQAGAGTGEAGSEPVGAEDEVLADDAADGEITDGEIVGGETADGDIDGAGDGAEDQGGAGDDALVEACRQRDEYLDALRRLQADFENYRKRVQRQQQESLSRAAEQLVAALLPALDAFDLAAAHLVGDEQASPGGLLQAVGLLRDTLAKEGLEQVGAVGDPFDPTAHEAVEHVEDADDGGPTVEAVLRSGYRFAGRIVRPAMVKVRG